MSFAVASLFINVFLLWLHDTIKWKSSFKIWKQFRIQNSEFRLMDCSFVIAELEIYQINGLHVSYSAWSLLMCFNTTKQAMKQKIVFNVSTTKLWWKIRSWIRYFCWLVPFDTMLDQQDIKFFFTKMCCDKPSHCMSNPKTEKWQEQADTSV